ncbi:GIY-YIG nuclease family protein [Kineococcus auxinigenes]|uniref:GIY-YIG nuclease family protein n=1 Tax=unclassified Kineococcus TaxID=2621656 RepID=UPI003D7C5E15
MSTGFVYILLNPSLPGMVKIGLTTGDSEARARKLSSSTSVPTEFVVVYDELVSDCRAVEQSLHSRFADYRVNMKREFFRVPIKEAIKALQWEAREHSVDGASERRFDMTASLKARWGQLIDPTIFRVEFVQLVDVCFLELSKRPSGRYRDGIVQQTDLAVLAELAGPEDLALDPFADHTFSPRKTLEENVATFLGLDELSLWMTTDLFDRTLAPTREVLHEYDTQPWPEE